MLTRCKQNMDALRENVMINQLSHVAGCPLEESRQLLVAANWQFEAALSLFLQEEAIPRRGRGTMTVPANTPETPPYFPEALMAFAKLRAGEPMQSMSAGSHSHQTSGGNASATAGSANSQNESRPKRCQARSTVANY